MKRRCILLVLFVLLFCIGTTVCAQLMPNATQSLSAYATNKLFLNDVDKVSDVTRFSEVEKGLFVLTLDSPTYLRVDYATRFNPLFLNFYYSGNVFDFTKQYFNTYETDPEEDVIGANILEEKVTKNPDPLGDDYDKETSTSNNFFDVTVGFGAIGIAASIEQYSSVEIDNLYDDPDNPPNGYETSTTTTDSEGNILTEDTKERTWEESTSSIIPRIRVGTVLPLGNMIVRPYIGVGVSFYDKVTTDKYSNVVRDVNAGAADYTGITGVTYYTDEFTQENNTYTSIMPLIGASVAMGDLSFGLAYRLGIILFGSKYTDENGKDQVAKGSAKTEKIVEYTYTPTATTESIDTNCSAFDYSYSSHTVVPYIEYTMPEKDRLALAFKFVPQIDILNEAYTYNKSDKNTTITNNASSDPALDTTVVTEVNDRDSLYEFSSLIINPVVSGAAQYMILPGKLGFNVGVTANLTDFLKQTTERTKKGVKTTETTTTDGNGSVTSTFTSDIGDPYEETGKLDVQVNQINLALKAGLTWNLTDWAYMDLLLSTSNMEIDASKFRVQFVIQR